MSHKKRAVLGCGRMFLFPQRDEARRQEWVSAAGDPFLLTLPVHKLIRRKICEKHFEPKYIMRRRLCTAAVPTLFLPERISLPQSIEHEDNTSQPHACNTLQDVSALTLQDKNQNDIDETTNVEERLSGRVPCASPSDMVTTVGKEGN